jgi:hypothetical protein
MQLELVTRYLLRALIGLYFPKSSRVFQSLLEDLGQTEKSFARKIDQAYESLHETSHLVEQLENELTDKIKRIDGLKSEYKRYSDLASLKEDEARAVVSQLESQLNRNRPKEIAVALGLNIAAGLVVFFLGILLSPFIKGLLGIGT